MAQITLRGVGHTYTQSAHESAWALNPLDLVWEDGRTYALLGPSGCGKTTMLNAIWRYGRTGTIALKVGNGSLGRCAALRYPVATRVAIPSLAIDLPVVRPPSGYPLCNVAMYIRELSQPREAGVSYIYAHARKGMFLPLLERSKVNNGASLLGMTVRVWTSDDILSTYQIIRVRRHVTTLDGIFGITAEQLWLQTSEGPNGTREKLIVIARRLGSVASDHAAAHPTPRPIVCS